MSNQKMQELQILEQNLQNILMQKQTFQLELSETQTAIEEISKSGEEVYKIISNLMLKSEKSKILEELNNKKRLIDMRIKSLEKQEQAFTEKIEEIRKELMKSSTSSKNKQNS